MTGRRADARDLLRPKTPPPCADGRYGEANEGNWRAAASISLASKIVRATPKPFAPAATLQQFAEVMCGFSRSMQHGRVLSVVQDRRHGCCLYEAYGVVVYVGACPPGPR